MILRGYGGTVVRFSAAESTVVDAVDVDRVSACERGARWCAFYRGLCVRDTRYLVVLRMVAVDRMHPPPR